VTLWLSATDEDNDKLSYIWKAGKGTFISGTSTATAVWQPPQVTSAEDDTVSVSVSDGIATATASIILYLNPPILQAPTLLAPANLSIDQSVSPTLSWNTSNGAISYGLQVSTSKSFGGYVYNDSGLTVTSQHVTGLYNSTAYYWRVNAKSSYYISGWSTVWSFTTVDSTGNPCPGTPTVVYAGKTYITVQIGSQCWLRENLDVGAMIQGTDTAYDNGVIEKYCYKNDPVNCNTYGGLYQWEEAMQYMMKPGTQGICPPGWHVPTLAEFQTLDTTVGEDGNALKAIGQGVGNGAGTNTSGFSAMFGAFRYHDGLFYDVGRSTYVWSSTRADSTFTYYLTLYHDGGDVNLLSNPKDYGYSVRCIKN
jgi:uncharacterized protein (TIGR02145 family)